MNTEIDTLWNECKKIFNVTDNSGDFKKILGARKPHNDGKYMCRIRFSISGILKEFGDDFTPKNVEYWVSYNPEKKVIMLKVNNTRVTKK